MDKEVVLDALKDYFLLRISVYIMNLTALPMD